MFSEGVFRNLELLPKCSFDFYHFVELSSEPTAKPSVLCLFIRWLLVFSSSYMNNFALLSLSVEMYYSTQAYEV